MRKVVTFLFSAVISFQVHANAVSLTDSQGYIDLNEVLRSSTDLENSCGQVLKGRQAAACKSDCGRLFDRVQDLSTTLGTPNVKQPSVVKSVRSYLGNLQSCAKHWPNNRGPMPLKPFVDLAQQMQKGTMPKSASVQSPLPSVKAIGFGNGSLQPGNKPKFVSPFFTLNRLVSKANLPHQCRGFGKEVEQCRQACTGVKIAAYELRDSVNGNASAGAIKAKTESIDSLLKNCAQYLPSSNKSLVEARQINNNLMSGPDVFEKWRALGKPPINAKNDENPTVYLNMLAGITRDTLQFCGRGVLEKCSPACESLARLGQNLQQSAGDLAKQSQALDDIEKYADYCGKNNVSPFLPAIKELAKHVKAHPEFLYTAEQLAAVNDRLEAATGQNSSYPPEAGANSIDVPAYPLSTGYELTPLSTTLRNRLENVSRELISTAGSVDNQKVLQAINGISKQSCSKSNAKNCSQVCSAVYGYAAAVHPLQNKPIPGIQRERVVTVAGQLPAGALRFMDKAAVCLNSFESARVVDEDVETLLQYYAFVESADPPSQPAASGYVFYASRVEMQQKVAQCTASNDIACRLSCENALSVSKALTFKASASQLTRLGELEGLLDSYIEQCQSSYVRATGTAGSIGNEWSMLLKERDYASEVDLESIKKAKELSQQQDRQRDPAYQFISQYQPEENAPAELKIVERNTHLSQSYAAVMDALLTIQNYCPETGEKRSCVALAVKSFIFPVSALYDANGLNNNLLGVLNNFVNSLGRSDNAETDSMHRRGGYRLYPKYESLSPAIRPAKFKVIDQFVDDVLAMKPSVIVSNNHRFYCGQKGRQANNPFIEYESCEFLSALYYRDFERLVSLEKLWVEPVLKKQAALTEGQNNIVFKFLANHNRTLLNNSEKTSMMPLVISSYLIDYNLYYQKCIKPDAKVYRYQDTKVTDFKNRYGHTLYSNSSSTTRTYSMNRDWAEIYDSTNLRLSESSVGMFSLIDTFHEESEITKAMEFEYNAKRPSTRAVLTDLNRLMQRHDCDSAVAKKLDARLQEFNNFRTVLGKMEFR